ncbi:MAG: hypothetical protein PARBB_03423 [Parabacteroides distasonis]
MFGTISFYIIGDLLLYNNQALYDLIFSHP